MSRCARIPAFASDERAASLVEFAVVLPVLFVFLFGIIDFGRALFLFNNLQDTARRAARLAAVQGTEPCVSSTAMIQDSVHAWVIEFNSSRAATSSYQVNVSCVDATGIVPAVATTVRVQIANYPFAPITPVPQFVRSASFLQLQLTVSAGARSEGAPAGS